MSRKNQDAIDKVLAHLNSHGPSRSNAIREATGLSKSELMGATRALKAEGRIYSEGATASLVWRLYTPGDAPPPSTTRRSKKHATKRVTKQRRKTARTRTPRAPKAEASSAAAPDPLDIAMDDAGRVRLTREGAAPFVLQTPEDHARLYAFLDRMEPVWSAP